MESTNAIWCKPNEVLSIGLIYKYLRWAGGGEADRPRRGMFIICLYSFNWQTRNSLNCTNCTLIWCKNLVLFSQWKLKIYIFILWRLRLKWMYSSHSAVTYIFTARRARHHHDFFFVIDSTPELSRYTLCHWPRWRWQLDLVQLLELRTFITLFKNIWMNNHIKESLQPYYVIESKALKKYTHILVHIIAL